WSVTGVQTFALPISVLADCGLQQRPDRVHIGIDRRDRGGGGREGGGGRKNVQDRFQRRRGRQHLLPERRAGHVGDRVRRRLLPEPLVVGEEEALVLPDRPAKIATRLILAQRRQGCGAERPAGEHRVVLVIEESPAVKRIGAGLGDNVYLSAAGGAAFRGVDGGIHAEFGHRIQRDAQARVRFLGLLLDAAVVDTVEGVVVIVDRAPGETDVALIASAAAACVDSTRRQRHQVGPVAAVQRNAAHLLFPDYAADFGRGAVHLHGGARDI